tara:strand:+ start:317 stop:1426 length:1110 start_codon:yes stop_codon:yes gene_type:complete
MEFFNKKEEVIDLQLTQYGKLLLSTGKLKPVYYAFHDENIIYDSNYAGFSETQNETHPRIQENTPNTKIIHNFHSIEDEMVTAVEIQNSGDPDLAQLMLQQTAEKSQVLINPLANSDLGTDKIPAWDLSLLSGKILTGSTSPTLTLSSSANILNIPQIEVEMVYRVEAETGIPLTSQEIQDIQEGRSEMIPQSILEQVLEPDTIIDTGEARPFEDGSFFTVTKDLANGKLIFQIVEQNVPQGNDNFEIEIFEIEDVDANGAIKNTTKITDLKQLRMLVEPELIINDILVDEADGRSLSSSDIDSSFADYYFEISTDDEISSALVCKIIDSADQDLYKFARKDFTCPDNQKEYQVLNPYSQKDSNNCGDT